LNRVNGKLYRASVFVPQAYNNKTAEHTKFCVLLLSRMMTFEVIFDVLGQLVDDATGGGSNVRSKPVDLPHATSLNQSINQVCCTERCQET